MEIEETERIEEIADSTDEVMNRHECNRSAWNEAAEGSVYTQNLQNTIEFIRSGKSNLHPIERDNLGSLSQWCQTAIHLQCASGRDTLSLWNEGVSSVVGIDISDAHIRNARLLSEALDAPAKWYRSDVINVTEELDGTADLVYTGRGCLCWLHDLDKWASTIIRLLKPGGIFHILDDHPALWLFEEKNQKVHYSGIDYFSYAVSSQGWPESYIGNIGKPVEDEVRKYERIWPLSTVIQSLIDCGLEILFVGEHSEEYWDPFPGLNDSQKKLLPMTFSIKSRKPE